MIRPEVRAGLYRWRGALVGAAVLALGLYWGLASGGLLQGLGWLLALGGGALALTEIQRARFAPGRGGPGYVTVIEGRIQYFGPLTGGMADLDDLLALTYDPRAHPAHWILARPEAPPLAIPLNAEGAEALFDAFAQLPGLRTEAMLRAMQSDREGRRDHPVVIWRAPAVQARTRRLH